MADQIRAQGQSNFKSSSTGVNSKHVKKSRKPNIPVPPVKLAQDEYEVAILTDSLNGKEAFFKNEEPRIDQNVVPESHYQTLPLAQSRPSNTNLAGGRSSNASYNIEPIHKQSSLNLPFQIAGKKTDNQSSLVIM